MSKRSEKIIGLVIEEATVFFPYVFIFYIVALLMSINVSWRGFFYWPALHIIFVIWATMFLSSEKTRKTVRFSKKIAKSGAIIRFPSFLLGVAISLFTTGYFVLDKVFILLGYVHRYTLRKIKLATWRDYLKAFFIALIFIGLAYAGIGLANSLVISLAILSILFFIDSDFFTWIALAILISMALCLLFKNIKIANALAIYVYYFMVLAIFTRAVNCVREKS